MAARQPARKSPRLSPRKATKPSAGAGKRGRVDLAKSHPAEYKAAAKPALVKVSPGQYLAVQGDGAPGSPRFTHAIGSIYGTATTIKFARKPKGKDFRVMPLEAQWWGQTAGRLDEQSPETMRWRVLMRVPDDVKPQDVAAARRALEAKGKPAGPVELSKLNEGECVQALHVGPYDKEAETIKHMADAAAGAGKVLAGFHHEIYLSDPGRTPPAKLKTILRHPVRDD